MIPLFQATPDGSGVNFEESYGASGDQSRAVAAGLPADYVAFSLEPDMDRLVKANMVASDWNSGATQGHGHRQRRRARRPQGQPQEHHTWDDLLQPGVRHHHAEPVQLGQRALEHHGRLRRVDQAGLTEEQATANLTTMFGNVLVQDTSGAQRDADIPGRPGRRAHLV